MGRISTQEVFMLSNSDLVPGKYEAKALSSEVQNGHLSFTGKRVLELGCGHGLPGIFACLEGAAAIHFQDFNAEVLQCLTIPNVNPNVPSFQRPALQVTKDTLLNLFSPHLYELIKKCITPSHGVVYMAAKKHYFGVGGGTRRFLSIVEKGGKLV
ncbi:hypothetical protein Pyn_09724 [Prunus yedoensis var. nudiflora]|uniref:protein-histidine N-methyltransferase n=1 Tax=Prunus yedoensis var. nudiflora TaxID=2094558 RepID=A0A314YWC1_PRUYE|nr:hypothetical protein Pyn_00506 [Prunus yedoensis var. nudiflora]PQQ10883.1 hypothetical protein Pyn_09724 [Prunus yedoensis var. nudiflora]